MANYCSNKIWFCAEDKGALQQLFNVFQEVYQNSKRKSYTEIFAMHGYTDEEARNLTDIRDIISYCGEGIEDGSSYYYFVVETETAWVPHMECWKRLLKDRYQNKIRLVYVSEECGSGIYITNDTEGDFVVERYKLDFYSDNACYVEYFGSLEELVDFINRYLCEDVTVDDSLDDMESKIIECQGDSACCTVAYFECDYRDMD